jgi:hypothetical protein
MKGNRLNMKDVVKVRTPEFIIAWQELFLMLEKGRLLSNGGLKPAQRKRLLCVGRSFRRTLEERSAERNRPWRETIKEQCGDVMAAQGPPYAGNIEFTARLNNGGTGCRPTP